MKYNAITTYTLPVYKYRYKDGLIKVKEGIEIIRPGEALYVSNYDISYLIENKEDMIFSSGEMVLTMCGKIVMRRGICVFNEIYTKLPKRKHTIEEGVRCYVVVGNLAGELDFHVLGRVADHQNLELDGIYLESNMGRLHRAFRGKDYVWMLQQDLYDSPILRMV